MSFRRRWFPTTSARIASATPVGSRTRSVAAVPAPHWSFRFMYDRESAAWGRRRDEPEHRELVERTADELANVVAPPGPVADLGCGPGAHALALARRGYDVVGVDGSPRMVEVARTRASITSQSLYWRLRAACYHLVPGIVRFYDTSSLPRLVEDQGLTVVECNGAPGRVSVPARARRRSSEVTTYRREGDDARPVPRAPHVSRSRRSRTTAAASEGERPACSARTSSMNPAK